MTNTGLESKESVSPSFEEKTGSHELKDGSNRSQRSSFAPVDAPVSKELGDAPQHDSSVPAAVADVEEQQPTIATTGKATHHVNDLSSVPDGGLRAWAQVAGSFFLFFNTWGIVNTFGVYNTYYILDILKDESPSNIAWIGSIQAFLLLIVGMMTGPIYDVGYFRSLIVTGSFLVVFGHMMLSLCTEYWQAMLAQALCVGIGMGCLFIPSVAILSTYFTKKLAFATGIAASGSSLGGVLYPIILHKLIPKIGFPWAVRTIGFICLATLLVPNFCMKVRVLPAERRKIIDTTAFKSLPFMLFCIGAFITFCGLYMPFFFLQTYAIANKITTEDFAFYLLSLLNAASIFGRIVPNFVADKLGPMNIIFPCASVSGILIFCLISIHNLGGIVIFALLFGFFSGSLVSLPPTIIVRLTKDRRYIGTRLGMCFGFVAVGTLIGSPIGGVILREKGFTSAWIFGGVLSTVGGVVIASSRIAHAGWNPRIKA